MRPRSLIVAVMAASTLVVGGAVGLPTVMNAAAAATSTAGKAHLATPDISNCRLVSPPGPGTGLDLFAGLNYTADEWVCGCNPGTTYDVTQPVKSFTNNCANKAWLQYQNNTPAPFCISELEFKADVGTKYQKPVSVLVGRETGEC